MSAFDEIKVLFTTEITNCPQYVVAIKIKNLIIQDILAPNIDTTFTYQLEDTDYIDIYIRYLGACNGCASSSTGTLYAIESTLKEKLSSRIRVLPI